MNTHGLLLERHKLHKVSSENFQNALTFTNDEGEKDQIKINLARVLVHLEKHKDAVSICASIKKASFASHCSD